MAIVLLSVGMRVSMMEKMSSLGRWEGGIGVGGLMKTFCRFEGCGELCEIVR